MKKYLFSLFVLPVLISALHGCGQDGPLYLPDKKEAAQAPVLNIPESAADAEPTQDDLSQQDWD